MLLAVTLSCKLLNRSGSKDGVVAGDISKIADNLPTYDPNAPPPSPGAAALRRLAELEPSVAALERDVEASERAAMRSIFDKLKTPRNAGTSTEKTVSGRAFAHTRVAFTKPPVVGTSFPALALLQGQAESGSSSINDAALVSNILSGWSDLFTVGLTKSESGYNVSKTATKTKNDVATTMSAEIGREEDGSTNFAFGVQTEGTKNGVAVKTDVAAKLDGQRCPNAEGQVSFTIKVRLVAQSGATSFNQELTAFVRAVVNDDAELASTTIDAVQATRTAKDGRDVYVESGVTFKADSDDYKNGRYSNLRRIQSTDNATRDDIGDLSANGHNAAIVAGTASLAVAKDAWRKGGCTKIEAKSPGTVGPSSSTSIPVKVRLKYDSSEIPSKLEAVLKGEKSVDPTSIAKTSGTLMYTAPNETGKSATISLTATSRRGRATLDLNASTGGTSYRVAGVSNGVSFTGEICSLDKPFVISAKFPGGSAETSFSPSGAAGGATTVSGGGGGCVHTGDGTYSITTKADGSGTLTWTTTDKLACPGFNNSRTATFTLPLQPAPEISCN